MKSDRTVVSIMRTLRCFRKEKINIYCLYYFCNIWFCHIKSLRKQDWKTIFNLKGLFSIFIVEIFLRIENKLRVLSVLPLDRAEGFMVMVNYCIKVTTQRDQVQYVLNSVVIEAGMKAGGIQKAIILVHSGTLYLNLYFHLPTTWTHLRQEYQDTCNLNLVSIFLLLFHI